MSDYTPDVSTFRSVYGQMCAEWNREDSLAEFDRMITLIKAETWTDGYLTAHWDMQDDTETPNPYEEEGTVSTWSERAHRAAEALDMEAIEATDPEDVQYGFREGARWQREALLSDESVERAARALYAEDINESMDTPWPDYDSPQNLGRRLYEERARNALTAVIGDDDE